MKTYRTSLLLDIVSPMLAGIGIVYLMDFILNPMIRLNDAGGSENYGMSGLPWTPSFEGKRDYFSVLSSRKAMHRSLPKEDVPILSSLNANYEMFDPENALFPTWIITLPNVSTIHRFFDSSPFSPSGRFLGLTRIPNIFKSASKTGGGSAAGEANDDTEAEVVIIDLLKGTEKVVFRTRAWGAQLGAQVQWGESDTDLLFNVAGEDIMKNHRKVERSRDVKSVQEGLMGMVLNPKSGHKKLLDCPVYHVSQDGKTSVSPQLSKIHYTQMGYGVDYAKGAKGASLQDIEQELRGYGPHTGAPKDDGVYVGNIETGSCELIANLRDLAVLAGVNPDSTPVYGFHTKFSSDGNLILFVLRSLELHGGIAGVLSKTGLGLESTLSIPRVRRQHLFAMRANGSDAVHLLSWSSEPYKAASDSGIGASGTNVTTMADVRKRERARRLIAAGRRDKEDSFDANHPSWVPKSHKISINLRRNAAPARGWEVAMLNVDDIYHRKASSASPLLRADIERLWGDSVLYNRSSGHPIFHPGNNNRYLVLDAYAKETAWFQSEAVPSSSPHSGAHVSKTRRLQGYSRGATGVASVIHGGKVSSRDESQLRTPLRIVDTHRNKRGDVWALKMPLFAEPGQGELRDSNPSQISSKHQHAWRCDMHPTWDPSYRWLAFNGRPGGKNRQVLISYTGGDLSKFIDEKPR